ncbi:MAG: SLC13 family permease [Deltaproteobacteria bacterium]|nr:SLC13 family permease [Deltaproteobacteria bacterium]MBN2671574.1 SLC13 family permease [Deltaproteobacteria bacterium]
MDVFRSIWVDWQAWTTLLVVAVTVVALMREWLSPEVALAVAFSILLAFGIINPGDAMKGFANHGVLTIAALFIVAQAVTESGGLSAGTMQFMGTSSQLIKVYIRMVLPITAISAFLNNTPVVAIFVPAIRTWAERYNVSLSKLLIPLSYASILGGMCTLIGTSTNLVVSGMMSDHGVAPIGMFEITKIGFPAAVVGILFLIFVAERLLPNREDLQHQMEGEAREYLVEMVIQKNCSLIGKSVEEGGLRGLEGLFLVRVDRDEKIYTPVSPNFVLRENDRLRFTGLVSTIVDLKSIKGLVPVEEAELALAPRNDKNELRLYEVVVATGSPLVGQGIRQAGFRYRYDAAVIAVHRSGQRIVSKIGDIVLKPGDTLMIEAPDEFAKRWYNSAHFYLVSRIGDVTRIRHEKAGLVFATIGAMILLPAFGVVPMIVSAFCAAAFLVVTNAVSVASAARSINLSILVVIACALGIGKAIENTGLAHMAAALLVGAVSVFGPVAALAAVMMLTNVFTELVTNKASAAMFFPVAIATATELGFAADSPQMRAFQMSIALSAAASFATPLGYQTNLIVYGPGGYKYRDFLKVGIPMNVLVIVTGVLSCWYWFF